MTPVCIFKYFKTPRPKMVLYRIRRKRVDGYVFADVHFALQVVGDILHCPSGGIIFFKVLTVEAFTYSVQI